MTSPTSNTPVFQPNVSAPGGESTIQTDHQNSGILPDAIVNNNVNPNSGETSGNETNLISQAGVSPKHSSFEHSPSLSPQRPVRGAAARNPFINNVSTPGPGGKHGVDLGHILLAGHSPAVKVGGARVLTKRPCSPSMTSPSKKKSKPASNNSHDPELSFSSPTPANSNASDGRRVSILGNLSMNSSDGALSIVSTTNGSESSHPGKENVNPRSLTSCTTTSSDLSDNTLAKPSSESLSSLSEDVVDLTEEQLDELCGKDYSVSYRSLFNLGQQLTYMTEARP